MLRVWVLVGLLLLSCGGPASPDAGLSPHDASVPDASVVDAGMMTPDAAIPEPSEPMPPTDVAGGLTITQYATRPFLSPANVDEVLQTGFSFGREFFVADWVPAPNGTRPNLDGLGPLLHATSCVACHPATGRPPSFTDAGEVDVGILFRLVGADGRGDPIYGGQLQPSAIAGVPGEATITFTQANIAAPPEFHFELEPTYGPLAPGTRALPRLSPHLAGMGLLEAVSDEALLALADENDTNGDGISGRVARLPNDAGIGRFGWKAVQSTLASQSGAAFAGDMGISSPGHPEDCTPAQTACLAAPNGGTPETTQADLDAVGFFMRYLGVPAARRDDTDPRMQRGHALFEYVGCAACHLPTLRTSPTAPSGVRDVTFHAYTDLLLHDLGPALADPLGEGVAQPPEWRTPPLWGLGLVGKDPAARFLHDGRAATLRDAILWHGGEATAARVRFERLRDDDAQTLLDYVRSL